MEWPGYCRRGAGNKSVYKIGKSSEEREIRNNEFGSGSGSGNGEISGGGLRRGGVIGGEILESSGTGGEKIISRDCSRGIYICRIDISGDKCVSVYGQSLGRRCSADAD